MVSFILLICVTYERGRFGEGGVNCADRIVCGSDNMLELIDYIDEIRELRR